MSSSFFQNLHGNVKAGYGIPGRSFWEESPVTMTLEPKPIRVRNIFICAGVVFWASSRMINALSSVRPRIYASGATSIRPRSIFFGKAVCAHDLIQSVVKRTQIGIDLALEVARKESQLLACLNGRSGKNDPGNLLIAKSSYCHSHGKIGFAGSGRSHAEHDHLLTDLFHIILLSESLGLDGSPLYGVAYKILIYSITDLPMLLPWQGTGRN